MNNYYFNKPRQYWRGFFVLLFVLKEHKMKKMKFLTNPIVVGIVAFIGGVMLADKIKPMLSGLPVIGGMFEQNEA